MANNKSPSPISSKNPNILETRKSFSGNNHSFVKPSFVANHKRLDRITHSNNPSDISRRWSVEKDRDFEKENEKDHELKVSKLRSPAKNTKNFMSPTISAASKFAPSPKNKILVERNDPLRTSISLCNGKATFFSSINASQDLDANSDFESDQNQTTVTSLYFDEEKEAVHEGPLVSKPPKRVTFSDFPSDYNPASESVVTDSDDNVKMKSGLKNNVLSSPVSSCVASPNPDSSLRPYDPKTNYLSPRPQFLHYKPNPRIGILLNKEKLEDNFLEEIMCGTFSDSESTEESWQGEFSQMEEEEITDNHDMVNGTDDTESCESPTVSNTVYSDNMELKREEKSRGFFKVACISILLVLLIACVSVSVTRSDQFARSGMSFSDLSIYYHEFKVSASEKISFEKLARHVNEFSENSVSFMSKLIGKHGKAENIGSLKFMNISDLQMSIWNEGHFRNNLVGKELVEYDLEQEDELEEDFNAETYGFEQEVDSTVSSEMEFIENLEDDDEVENGIAEEESLVKITDEDGYTEIEEESLVNLTADKDGDTEIEEESLVNFTADKDGDTEIENESLVKFTADKDGDVEIEEVTLMIVTSDLATVTDSESENSVFVENKTVSCMNTDEITFQAETIEDDAAEMTKAVEIEAVEKATVLDNEKTVDSLISSEASQSSLKNEAPIEIKEKKLAHYIIGFSSLFGALLGVTALVYNLKSNNRSGNIVVETKPFLKERIHQDKRISKNLKQEIEEPCSSEMSSFNSAVNGKKLLRGETEARSFEGKPRRYSKRESLASSSMDYSTGALSYGSFTTFERIPVGEDEIMTPVRRSSRLRMQVTSP